MDPHLVAHRPQLANLPQIDRITFRNKVEAGPKAELEIQGGQVRDRALSRGGFHVVRHDASGT